MGGYVPTAVYGLCLVTSSFCASLLLRAFFRVRSPVLLWTGVSFIFLALNKLFLLADMTLVPPAHLWLLRQGSALAALAVLLYGFIWRLEP